MLDNSKLIVMLKTMLKIRKFEEKACQLMADGELPGWVHAYIGEEAVAVGSCFALEESDYITSTHRGHGHCIAKGLDPKSMMAELFGKKTGYSKGKGGSMHIADFGAGMLGANGVLASGVPIAVGAGISSQYLGEKKVALSFFGDGATGQGQLHEAINLAATWSLPVVFVCENNQYGEMTHYKYSHNIEKLSDMSTSYGIPGVSADGMDVEAVFNAVSEAVNRARKGEGPTFVECETYRYKGHFEGDPEEYRNKEEVTEWRSKRDPITQLTKRLINEGTLTEGEFEKMERDLEKEMEEAVKYAKESAYPELDEAYKDVLSEDVILT